MAERLVQFFREVTEVRFGRVACRVGSKFRWVTLQVPDQAMHFTILRKDIKLGVPFLDAAFKVRLNSLERAINPSSSLKSKF